MEVILSKSDVDLDDESPDESLVFLRGLHRITFSFIKVGRTSTLLSRWLGIMDLMSKGQS